MPELMVIGDGGGSKSPVQGVREAALEVRHIAVDVEGGVRGINSSAPEPVHLFHGLELWIM